MRRSILFLACLLVFAVWYRAHTFAPLFATGVVRNLWPAAVGPSEPLDCDEAAYAYIGHRLLEGDVMYRDLTENKPPLGYWLYALGVGLGGYRELAVRLLPLPFVLGTIALVWWIGGRLGGPLAACLAAALYVVLSTDPYVFGNGSNMEHFMNLFSTASLAGFLLSRDRPDRSPRLLAVSGACLGAAVLVKQVAIVPAVVFGAAILLDRKGESWKVRMTDLACFLAGSLAVIGLAAAALLIQEAGRDAYEDILLYGRALATDTLPDPLSPSAIVRWLTGNADPGGRLPWPFGSTNYLVWWGAGCWPVWLAAVPAVGMLLLRAVPGRRSRLLAFWTLASAVEVSLPGLYWQHYYLLLTPGVSLAVGTVLANACRPSIAAGIGPAGLGRRVMGIAWTLSLVAAVVATAWTQFQSYLLVPPQELTVRFKGGGQWLAMRALGGELARRSRRFDNPRLYVWGWQSPLHFYSRLDGVSRHFFVDNLLRDQAERNHPLIAPRIAEIGRSLRERRPAFIFAGYPPFPELLMLLRERYAPSPLVPARNGMGLWVDRDLSRQFEHGVPADEGQSMRSDRRGGNGR